MKAISFLVVLSIMIMGCEDRTEPAAEAPFSEKHRPKFHFTPPSQWMNDPNGLVFLDGEYHLFYQHYPDSNVWGPMHWGHAVSVDLVHWENLPIALYPDSLGYIFSGSAVYDQNNTSGLGTSENPPLVAIFTYHEPGGEFNGSDIFQYQGIAFSLDAGRTWEKFTGNPVLANPGIRDFRDPKVSWFDEFDSWIMALAVKDRIQFYGSKDLITWQFLSEFGSESGSHGGVWECPDLFELQIDGSDKSKWVLLVSINPGGPNGGSATQYFVGHFDGKEFIPDPDYLLPDEQAVWLDHGRDDYAGVTWSNIPDSDGRRLFIGWMSNWDYAKVVPTYAWRSAMTTPRELRLIDINNGIRVKSMPVRELDTLREDRFEFPAGEFTKSAELLRSNPGQPLLLEMNIEFAADQDVEFHLKNDHGEMVRFGYDQGKNQFYIDRTLSGDLSFSNSFSKGLSTMPRVLKDRPVRLTAFIDVASIEIFVDDGAGVMTEIFFPTHEYTSVVNGSSASLEHSGMTAYSLQSIW